ncbi:MAG: 2-oxoacid:acceptor oxidoreductase family protein [Candidatus Omnitrophica bacterium]|nr:2-oxoacid:acceptor oxidoreductase family protein [Candidatus Omnitrophota bacterium]
MPDKRFTQEEESQVYTGTELLFKGALEAGVAFMTGYPGSPVADFFNVAQANSQILKEYGIAFQMANNEALSAARLNGSQMGDIRAMSVIKSVGAHVASDGLALGNLAKRRGTGGAVVVIGDDPWSDSTQVPTDSRYLSKHLHMPVMEPASFQEMKDWLNVAFLLSNRSGLFVAYLVTTNLADGGGTVQVHPNVYPTLNTRHRFSLETELIPVEETVILSPRTSEQEETLEARYRILLQEVRHTVNQILHAEREKSHDIGFIASGLAYRYLEHALYEFGLSGKFPILKLGISYPIDPEILLEFTSSVKEIYVVEEKRDFLESQVATILKDAYQQHRIDRFIPVWGKTFPKNLLPFPKTRGLNPSVLMERLGPVLKMVRDVPIPVSRINEEITLIEQTGAYRLEIPERTPTFCPGCPHRDSSTVLLDVKKSFMDPAYMRKKHGRDKVDLLFHGDTGCYTMLMFEPNKPLMHNYSGMGLGGGTGAGITSFITNKQVVFMGDSTFFHSGMIAISDALKHNQDITFIILENGTTAMTGHQPTPGTACDIAGGSTIAQSIEEVIRGMLHGTNITITRINPAYRETYRELLEETILKGGVKVIIADKECGITYHRKMAHEENRILKEKGFLPVKRHINITPEVCEFCLECTKATGCPGLTVVKTPYGPKIQADLTNCVADGACSKGKVCPSFEEVIVKRRKPPRDMEEEAEPLPEVSPRSFEELWNVYIAGVGGMGIGVITAILVRAGHQEGYTVHFSDKKGLAIRNGGVYSHLTYAKNGAPISPIIPYGKADLILAIDILEGVRGLDPHMNMRIAHPNRTAAIVNTEKTPTIRTLIGEDDFDVFELEKTIQSYTRKEEYLGVNISEISQRLLGDKLYANLVMLGIAYQRGQLPLGLKNLEWAIAQSVKPDRLKENLKAFWIGRDVVIHPSSYGAVDETMESSKAILAQKMMLLSRDGGEKLSLAYQALVKETIDHLRLDDATHQALALRIYDLIRYENLAYARRYTELVKSVYGRDRAPYRFEATRAVIEYLHKVMVIKDEVYVSYLLTSEEKIARDQLRYNVDPRNGDQMIYRHLNRPEFTIFGRSICFDITTRNWQLKMMRRMKFLRRLLPQWHRREKAFRDWYIELIHKFHYYDEESYASHVEALKSPEIVKGYRQIRYPKMEEAQALVASLLHPKRPVHFAAGQAPRL